jgi:hypothetical protein
MCGIFGAIGSNINIGKIRALAVANRERGRDSLGFFDSSAKLVKRGSDPYKALGESKISEYLAHPRRWFLAGHTRQATQGAVSDKNAHPFRFGNIVGAHNGVVSAPRKYTVDSEYLFDALDKSDGDYQRAFADISGYWALSYFDGDAFYLQTHDNSVWVGRDETNTWYYSSEATHLKACTGISNMATISDGAGLRFSRDGAVPTELTSFVSHADRMMFDYRTVGDYRDDLYDTAVLPDKARKGKKSSWPDGDEMWGEADSADLIEYDKCAKSFGYRGLRDFMDKTGCISFAEAFDMIDGMINHECTREDWREAFAEYQGYDS